MKLVAMLSVLLAFPLFYASPVSAQEDVIAEANAAYASGDLSTASSKYHDALQQGFENANIRYNLANTQLQRGLVGRAIANFRRAGRLAPRDGDVTANLDFARSQVAEPIVYADPPLWEVVMGWPRTVLSDEEAQSLALLLYVLFWLLVGLEPWWRPTGGRFAEVGVACVGLYLAVALLATQPGPRGEFRLTGIASASRPAVVIDRTAKIFSGASEESQVVSIAADGSEVLVGREQDGWLEVFLPQGRRGWARADSLELV
ncbi:MAG: hypothetical protein KDD44_05125 [Bdellovibrionales bacterium]|nr:hypothetical protein [Bdellovibrionales bacterium]